jgi:ABC-type oligopeptide transport system substrate-binding subunit
MLSFNNHAAFNARVSPDDVIYADLKARDGSDVRFALYYRGYLVWRDPADKAWSLSLAEKAEARDYRQVGNSLDRTYAFGFATRRETLAAIDRRHAAKS